MTDSGTSPTKTSAPASDTASCDRAKAIQDGVRNVLLGVCTELVSSISANWTGGPKSKLSVSKLGEKLIEGTVGLKVTLLGP